jgi:hypothetical protein
VECSMAEPMPVMCTRTCVALAFNGVNFMVQPSAAQQLG